MSEDIHFRMYLKRKGGGYVNAHEVCEWNPEHTAFSEPFEGRNYDVFSLFGSARGNYELLPSARFGLPDFLKGSDLDRYCRECGFYGFVWFNVIELKNDLQGLIDRLHDPLKYFDPDSDEYAAWKDLRAPGNKTEKQMEKLHRGYSEWYDEHTPMLMKAYELHEKIQRFVDMYCPAEEKEDEVHERPRRFDPQSPYAKLFDMEETVFLFFFDS